MIAETARFMTAHADASTPWVALTLWAFVVWAVASAVLYAANRRQRP